MVPQGLLRHIGRSFVASYTEREIESTAGAIKRYLLSRPNASETVDGVAKWWLLKQRYIDSIEKVQQALDMLEGEGYLTKLQLKDGKDYYTKSLNDQRMSG